MTNAIKTVSAGQDLLGSGGSDGRRSRDLSIFSRTLYQLSYRAERPTCAPSLGCASHMQSAYVMHTPLHDLD